jgi:hypothetical protein
VGSFLFYFFKLALYHKHYVIESLFKTLLLMTVLHYVIFIYSLFYGEDVSNFYCYIDYSTAVGIFKYKISYVQNVNT